MERTGNGIDVQDILMAATPYTPGVGTQVSIGVFWSNAWLPMVHDG
jgi:hypothetical protein